MTLGGVGLRHARLFLGTDIIPAMSESPTTTGYSSYALTITSHDLT